MSLCAGFLQLRRAGATLCCGAWASHCGGFSCCRARALDTWASVVVARGPSSCAAWAQLLRGMWDLPRPGLEPVSPALAGGCLTTAPPGKPCGGNLRLRIIIGKEEDTKLASDSFSWSAGLQTCLTCLRLSVLCSDSVAAGRGMTPLVCKPLPFILGSLLSWSWSLLSFPDGLHPPPPWLLQCSFMLPVWLPSRRACSLPFSGTSPYCQGFTRDVVVTRPDLQTLTFERASLVPGVT